MRVISLGWGVQSFTLVAMAALGELEPVAAAVHSDTGFESSLTYDFAKRWTPWLQEHGVRIETVIGTTGDLSELYIVTSSNRTFLMIPAFMGNPDGSTIIGRRQCTSKWKIAPLRRWLQANRNKEPIDQIMGISWDERERMRTPDVQYIRNVYPLVEMRMTRNDCKQWLKEHELEIPPKSACVFCPYHSMAQWRETKAVAADWERTIEADNFIRIGHDGRKFYLNQKGVPVTEMKLATPEEMGQLNFFECSGTCWI